MRVVRYAHLLLAGVALTVGTGCHREESYVELKDRRISIVDRFFDVQALDADHAVVAGYGGKFLMTADGGFTWTQSPTGTTNALYSVHFVDKNNGWVVGQDGLLMHTVDGGKTWKRQESGTSIQLFALDFVSPTEGWAVGDRALALHTTDAGEHWEIRKIETKGETTAEEQIASVDPVLYDVHFVNPMSGWIVGEFGKIVHTADGGKTWTSQEASLIGGEVTVALDLPTFYGVNFRNETEGVASGLDGRLARTSDGGQTWHFEKMKLDFPMIDPLFCPALLPGGAGWAVGAAGEVVRMDPSNGGTWQRVKLGMEVVTWMRGMHWLDDNNGWIVGGYGLILHTKDGGKTWVPSVG